MGTAAIAGGIFVALIIGFFLGMMFSSINPGAGVGDLPVVGNILAPPEPEISITNVRINEVEKNPLISECYVLGILRAENEGAEASVSFTLVNSGNGDGFAVVEMVARGSVVDSNRYFVDAGSSITRSLESDQIKCDVESDEIRVRIGRVEPA